MFDIGWTELLIFAVVTLIFVGPNELPVLMRTVGRYFGMVRQQADEFRRHFDAAMQEAEFDRVRAELDAVSDDLNEAVRDSGTTLSVGATGSDKPEPTKYLTENSASEPKPAVDADDARAVGREKDQS